MRGLGDKPVRTDLTHATLPADCVNDLNKLGRFDEFERRKIAAGPAIG
jgi:hypothetical protein